MNGPHIVPVTVGPVVLGTLHHKLPATGVALGIYAAIAGVCLAAGTAMRIRARREEARLAKDSSQS